jgi:hypothetical protein
MTSSYEGDDFSKKTTAKPEIQTTGPVQAVPDSIENPDQPDETKVDQDVDKIDEHMVDGQSGMQAASWQKGNGHEFGDLTEEHDSHVMGIKEDG